MPRALLRRSPRALLILAALLCAALAVAPAAGSAHATAAKKPAPVRDGRSGNPIAPESACPNQTQMAAPAATQLATMLCMANYARTASGLKPLVESKPLARAAVRKTADILTCNQFSHEACGHQFTYWMGRYGYLKGCWAAAENIAWGTGTLGTVREIFIAWMQSPDHRANLLGPYTEVGMSFAPGTIEGNAGAMVWTQDFGSHSC